MLSDKETLRYSRHLMLEQIGAKGQLSLKNARVAVVGAGGLGSPVLLYLAAAGVGLLRLIDDDEVALSNLQRQVLYKINHLGQAKVTAATKVLTSLNNLIELEPRQLRLNEDNADELLNDIELVVDCSDNFATRYLLNHLCKQAGRILVSGAAIAGQGQLMGFDFRASDSPCYACVFPPGLGEGTLNCANAGVSGPLLGVVGSMQAQLVMNYLLGLQKGSLFRSLNAFTLEQKSFSVTPDPQCPVCHSLSAEFP